MTQPPYRPSDASRTASKTIIVILTVFGVCCVAPLLVCLTWSALGMGVPWLLNGSN